MPCLLYYRIWFCRIFYSNFYATGNLCKLSRLHEKMISMFLIKLAKGWGMKVDYLDFDLDKWSDYENFISAFFICVFENFSKKGFSVQKLFIWIDFLLFKTWKGLQGCRVKAVEIHFSRHFQLIKRIYKFIAGEIFHFFCHFIHVSTTSPS